MTLGKVCAANPALATLGARMNEWMHERRFVRHEASLKPKPLANLAIAA